MSVLFHLGFIFKVMIVAQQEKSLKTLVCEAVSLNYVVRAYKVKSVGCTTVMWRENIPLWRLHSGCISSTIKAATNLLSSGELIILPGEGELKSSFCCLA